MLVKIYRQQCKAALILNAIIASFDPRLISSNALPICELIKEADVNGDGKLDFLEFSKAMLNKEGPWGGDFTRR